MQQPDTLTRGQRARMNAMAQIAKHSTGTNGFAILLAPNYRPQDWCAFGDNIEPIRKG